VVQNKIAEARMAFKVQAEQILSFALVPIGSVNKFCDARKGFSGQRRGYKDMNPASFAFTVKNIAQLPFARALLDNQPGETEIPFEKKASAQFRQCGANAVHFADRTGIELALHLA